MPVADHPVHPSVRIDSSSRYGCWNKPRPKSEEEGGGYWAKDRLYMADGTFAEVPVFIPFRMSAECRFDQQIGGWRCEGCMHAGSDYVNQVKGQSC